jgi:membrane-associated phospholipid phosphatase
VTDFSDIACSLCLLRSLCLFRSRCSLRSLARSLAHTFQITAGRPRPDLFARCQLPSTLTSNPTHSLTSWTACTDTSLLNDGFRSFFSGHSSFAWCGMWFLILYLAASECGHNPNLSRKRRINCIDIDLDGLCRSRLSGGHEKRG